MGLICVFCVHVVCFFLYVCACACVCACVCVCVCVCVHVCVHVSVLTLFLFLYGNNCYITAMDCGMPEDGNHAIKHVQGTSPGDVTTYECEPCYTTNSVRTSKCETNGMWSHRAPDCVKMGMLTHTILLQKIIYNFISIVYCRV